MNEDDWYLPATLFREGYPPALTSALRALPQLRQVVRDEVAGLGGSLILEVGPGDAPVAEGLGRVVYLDLVPVFLQKLGGPRVRADLFHALLDARTFDVVVAADVLTHVRPARRVDAVAALADLGRQVVLFNPETGSERVPGSRVVSRPLSELLTARGFRVKIREFMAFSGGTYRLMLFTARR